MNKLAEMAGEASAKSYSRKPCFESGDGIICAGLPRSGTLSLTTALTTLGISPAHHALTMARRRDFYAWEHAAWCNLPNLRLLKHGDDPWARAPSCFAPRDPLLPWRRADWDRLIGEYRSVSDIASLFTEDLIRCYPEAKVILVERDLEAWLHSFTSIFVERWFFGLHWFVLCFLGRYAGYPVSSMLYDISIIGWLGARAKQEVQRSLPIKHREHSEMVRRLVPAENLLVFRLEDGWEPLCKFLGVPVPEGPFPHVNDQKSLMAFRKLQERKLATFFAARLGVLAAVAVGLWAAARTSGLLRSALSTLIEPFH